jgi:hypothetical protein
MSILINSQPVTDRCSLLGQIIPNDYGDGALEIAADRDGPGHFSQSWARYDPITALAAGVGTTGWTILVCLGPARNQPAASHGRVVFGDGVPGRQVGRIRRDGETHQTSPAMACFGTSRKPWRR